MISSLPAFATPGSTTIVNGTQFTGHGYAEAAGGTAQTASSAQPILVLRREDSSWTITARSTSWSGTSFFAVLPAVLPKGPYQARVVVDGIPSVARPLVIR